MQFDGGGDTLPANPPKTIAPTPLAAQEGGAIGAASMASQYKEPGKGAGMKTAKAPKAIDKSNWDKGTKVPESTVKAVKDAGRGNMGAVPQRIVKNDAIGLSAPGYVGSQLQYNAPVSKEYKTLNYGRLMPLVVEAFKEQQKEIEELKQLVNKLINK
jgi:hypothetical protein